MKCQCGAEIPDGSKYCGFCGRQVEQPMIKCCVCGNDVRAEANFCPICGNRITNRDEKVKCKFCGRLIPCDASYCGFCGKKQNNTYTNNKFYLFVSQLLLPIKTWFTQFSIDRRDISNDGRIRKILIISLIIGICITFTGFAGRIAMDQVSKKAMSTNYFQDIDPEMGQMLNRSTGRTVRSFMVAVIKNDSTGFIKLINQLVNTAGSMAGDPYGLNVLAGGFISMMAQEVFQESRAELIQQSGIFWYLLLAMAYYHELLVVGIIIFVISGIGWYIKGAKLADFKELGMQPVIILAAAWMLLVVIITIIGVININLTQ